MWILILKNIYFDLATIYYFTKIFGYSFRKISIFSRKRMSAENNQSLVETCKSLVVRQRLTACNKNVKSNK